MYTCARACVCTHMMRVRDYVFVCESMHECARVFIGNIYWEEEAESEKKLGRKEKLRQCESEKICKHTD